MTPTPFDPDPRVVLSMDLQSGIVDLRSKQRRAN
jgi:hypothetical protein